MFATPIILWTIAVATVITTCHKEEINVHPPEVNVANVNNESASAMGTLPTHDYQMQFRLPFIDAEIYTERSVHLIHEPQNQLVFVLSGSELHQLLISNSEKRVSFVGRLEWDARSKDARDAKMVSWRNYLLLVIAFEDSVVVYQIGDDVKNRTAQERESREAAPTFEIIQKLTLSARHQQHLLVEPVDDKILLIVAVNDTQLGGRLKTFEWLDTYFDSIEEYTMPMLYAVDVVGGQKDIYLIAATFVKQKSKTILSVYQVQLPSMHLKPFQTLTINASSVRATSFNGDNYLITCSPDELSCNAFKMTGGQFSVYKRRPSRELAFDVFKSGGHYLVGTCGNEVRVFADQGLDCYLAYRMTETNASTVVTHVNGQGEDFLLLQYKRADHTLIRIVQLVDENDEIIGPRSNNRSSVNDGKSDKSRSQHRFEETIGRLRSLLLRRQEAMDVFRRVAANVSTKGMTMKSKTSVTVAAGHIDVINIVDDDLLSPVQLLNRVTALAADYHRVRTTRSARTSERLTGDDLARLKVQELRVGALNYNGTILPGFHLNTSAKPMPVLTVRAPLQTAVLSAQELLTRQRTPSASLVAAMPSLYTRQLHVKRINGVPWSEYYDALFLKKRDSRFEGRLELRGRTTVDSLMATHLSGRRVDKLFNLVRPQVIYADLLMKQFKATELHADDINGLSFEKDVVVRGQDNVIATPIIMSRMKVLHDVLPHQSGGHHQLFRLKGMDMGQNYTGRVRIKGSLTVQNLRADIGADVLINGTLLSQQDIQEQYLLNGTQQEFKQAVIIDRARLVAPSLWSKHLNHHPTECHLRMDAIDSDQLPVFLVFMRAKIEQSLTCRDHVTRLANISKEAVRRDEIASIKGFKTFEAPLTINHLMALKLNHVTADELVLKSQANGTLTLNGLKSFDRVQVLDEVHVTEMLNAKHLNGLPIGKLLNYDYHLDNLTLPYTLAATNVVFHKINGVSVDKVFAHFRNERDRIVLHKDLIVEGNVEFAGDLKVGDINGIDWPLYQRSLVNLYEDTAIHGSKRFLDEVVVTRMLRSAQFNDMNMSDVFSRVLSKTRPQVIDGRYVFGALSVTNVDVAAINEVPTTELYEVPDTEMVIDGDVAVRSVTVAGNVVGHVEGRPDLPALATTLERLPMQDNWLNVHVLGNATWDAQSGGDLDLFDYLRRRGVTGGGNHVISGNVRLTQPLIRDMVARSVFPDGVDLVAIATDALLRSSTVPQVVTGEKVFTQQLHLTNARMSAFVDCNALNGIDVSLLNASLYRLSSAEVISGSIRFEQPPRIGNATVRGTVNDIETANIYQTLMAAPVPPLKMERLHVEGSLHIRDINNMSLDYLLQNRITRTGEALEVFGFLTFADLVLDKVILLQSINDFSVDTLVTRHSDTLQAIMADKRLGGELTLAGPVHVLHLNGRDLIESYQRTVFTNRNYHLDSLVADRVTFRAGSMLTHDRALTSRPLLDAAARQAPAVEPPWSKASLLSEIQAVREASLASSKRPRKRLLYVDYEDEDYDIVWEAANAESISETYTFERERLSLCQRRVLHVDFAKGRRRIFAHNETSSSIAATTVATIANAVNCSARAENYCGGQFRKVRAKVIVTMAAAKKSFGTKTFVAAVEIVAASLGRMHVTLLTKDTLGQRNELRILSMVLDDGGHIDVKDVAAIAMGSGSVVRSLSLSSDSVVLLTSLSMRGERALQMHIFSPSTHQLALAHAVDGTFDLVEMIAMAAGRHQLLLGCSHCHQLRVYEVAPHNGAWPALTIRLYQLITLSHIVDGLSLFRLPDGNRYMLTLAEHGHAHVHHHLYRFAPLLGWRQLSSGQSADIRLALPLTKVRSGRGDVLENRLLLLCNARSCRLLKAVF